MPAHECKPLLDTCGPDIYSRNAFRLLGANVDQKGRRIKRREKELLAAIEVDELADEYSNALRPNPLPPREELSQAVRELNDAQQRFIHEFFWFWPLEWGESTSDEVLNVLKAGKTKEAQKQWTQIATEGGKASLVAKHNLAVLGHLLALNQETKVLASTDNGELTREKRKEINAYWSFAFKYWESLCEDEGFWSTQADRIRTLGDPRLTSDFLNRFSKSLPIAFDNINADMAVAYCSRGMYDRAKDHVRIMKATNAGYDDVDASLRRVTDPLHGRIDQAIETAKSELINNKTEGKRRCIELFNTVRSTLHVLQALLGKESQEYRETCDRVAESMLQCQVVYGNETQDWDGSLLLLEAAIKITRGDTIRGRIQENIDILKGNIDTGLCWYCKKRKGEDDKHYDAKMYRVLKLKNILENINDPDYVEALGSLSANQRQQAGQALMQGGDPTLTRSVTLKIPRCSNCQKKHSTGNMSLAGTLLIVAALATATAVSFEDGAPAFWWSVAGWVIAVIVGFIVKGVYLSSQGISWASSVNTYPAVKELLARGWSIGTQGSENG